MKLIDRLSLAICSWTEVLTGDSSEHGVDTTMDTTPTTTQLPHKLGGTPELEVCVCVCVRRGERGRGERGESMLASAHMHGGHLCVSGILGTSVVGIC